MSQVYYQLRIKSVVFICLTLWAVMQLTHSRSPAPDPVKL